MNMRRFNKFGNNKVYVVPGSDHHFRTEHDARYYCEINGVDFSSVEKYDSTKEFRRWQELRALELAGEISELRRQVEFELIPAKYERAHIRDKVMRLWFVMPGRDTSRQTFPTRRKAEAYCKENGLPYRTVDSVTYAEPVYKDVCIEQNAVYTADFVYKDGNGTEIVEDTKSEATRKEPDYVLRRKLMLHVHGIRIKET